MNVYIEITLFGYHHENMESFFVIIQQTHQIRPEC